MTDLGIITSPHSQFMYAWFNLSLLLFGTLLAHKIKTDTITEPARLFTLTFPDLSTDIYSIYPVFQPQQTCSSILHVCLIHHPRWPLCWVWSISLSLSSPAEAYAYALSPSKQTLKNNNKILIQ